MLGQLARKLQYLTHTAIINIETVKRRGNYTLKDLGEIKGVYAPCCCPEVDTEEAFDFIEPVPPLLKCLRYSAFFGNERKRLAEILAQEAESLVQRSGTCTARQLEITLRPHLKRPVIIVEETVDHNDRPGNRKKKIRHSAPTEALALLSHAIDRHNTVVKTNHDVTVEDIYEICSVAHRLHAKVITHLYGVEQGDASEAEFRLAKEAAESAFTLLTKYRNTIEFLAPQEIASSRKLCKQIRDSLDAS